MQIHMGDLSGANNTLMCPISLRLTFGAREGD